MDEQSYVESLFGHQDGITSIDALNRERCMTSGSRDKTVRMWKIPEESQLVYRCGTSSNTDELLMLKEENDKKKIKALSATGGSVDLVCMVDEDTFLTGTDSGQVAQLTKCNFNLVC